MSIWHFEHTEPPARDPKDALASIYDFSDRPARLPEEMPLNIPYAVVREDEGYVCSALDIDIASQGDTPEEAVANFREALALYFAHREELASSRVVAQGTLVPSHAQAAHAGRGGNRADATWIPVYTPERQPPDLE